MDTSVNRKKQYFAWTMYDWANSAYPLVINTAIFPIYYTAMTTNGADDIVTFASHSFHSSALYSYIIGFAYLCVSLITPILSGIADYSGKKKVFLQLFSTIGAVSCAGLYFFTKDTLVVGMVCVLLSTIGFSGSLVFYNAFLPIIAPPSDHDKLSARGFAMGYIGSSLLLIFCLALLLKPALFGITVTTTDSSQIFVTLAPLTFLIVALWWYGFAFVTFLLLKEDITPQQLQRKKQGIELLFHGFHEVTNVLNQLRSLPRVRTFLISFFMYSMGVQTVILMSTIFGERELHLGQTELIITIVLLQFVAIGGSFGFSFLSSKTSNTFALLLAICIWSVVCLSAYFVTTTLEFYVLAGCVGTVLGGIQSLSRSTFAKLLPTNSIDQATFFSFYDICEKVGIVIGMFSYGKIADMTGSTRMSIVALFLFFVAGGIIMYKLHKQLKPRTS